VSPRIALTFPPWAALAGLVAVGVAMVDDGEAERTIQRDERPPDRPRADRSRASDGDAGTDASAASGEGTESDEPDGDPEPDATWRAVDLNRPGRAGRRAVAGGQGRRAAAGAGARPVDDEPVSFDVPGSLGAGWGLATVAVAGLGGVLAPWLFGLAAMAFGAALGTTREEPVSVDRAALELAGFLCLVATGLATLGVGVGPIGEAVGTGLVGGAVGLVGSFLRENVTLEASDDRPAERDWTRVDAFGDRFVVDHPDAPDRTVPWTAVEAVEHGPEAVHLRIADDRDVALAVRGLNDPDEVARTCRERAAPPSGR
jgi:hypothetical protein